jgi:hypothetical protein
MKIDAANMGNLHSDKATTSPQSSPAQNTRSKTAVAKPNCTTEVRTIEQEMVLACIETYAEVIQTPLQPAQLTHWKLTIVLLKAFLNNDTGKLMEMRHLLRNPKYTKLWGKSYTKDFGRLAQGVSGMKGTDTIVFIRYNKIPLNRSRHITYGKTVVTYWPVKDDPNRTRLNVGGNRIVHHGNVSTRMVKMMTVKMHLNSVISKKGAQYCTFNLKDFYLNMPMERPEYMQMKLSDLPQEFVDLYNLTKIAEDNGNVYIKIQKGMYGFPQAGILAHGLLDQRLNEHGYQQSQVTLGLWKHALRPISFRLCVDNFSMKYVGREHAEHLLQVLNMHYKFLQDWDGKKYLNIDIDCDYKQRKVHVLMLEYVPEALMQFQHKAPSMPQHQPYPHVTPTYGATCQYAEASDMSELLSKENKIYPRSC